MSSINIWRWNSCHVEMACIYRLITDLPLKSLDFGVSDDQFKIWTLSLLNKYKITLFGKINWLILYIVICIVLYNSGELVCGYQFFFLSTSGYQLKAIIWNSKKDITNTSEIKLRACIPYSSDLLNVKSRVQTLDNYISTCLKTKKRHDYDLVVSDLLFYSRWS